MVESPLCVFISHAPADEAPRARLEAHLGLMRRQGLISTWHRGLIVAGQASAEEIVARLRAAHLVVLLISARFLDSDDCYEREMKLALARHTGGDARTIPVLVEACDWETAPFAELMVLPEGGKPIKSWRVQSEAWASVARGIRAAAALLQDQRLAGHAGQALAKGLSPGSAARSLSFEPGSDEPLLESFRHQSAAAPADIPPEALAPRFRMDRHSNLRGRPHQVLAGPDALAGRERQTLDILENLGPSGAMISGRRGVGKTALALHLAQELAPHYPDGVIHVDLAGKDGVPLSSEMAMARMIAVMDPDAMIARVVHSLRRLGPEDAEPVRETYRKAFDGKQAILLLDNARDGEQVEPLIPPSGCLLLVTSRHDFQLPGLYARRLDPLAPDDAIALIRSLAPRLDEATASAVAELCSYLPRALHVAAPIMAEENDLDDTRSDTERLRSARLRLEAVEAAVALACSIDAPS
ncbi:TIR domain-containing protein [Sorangium sp. So ce1078]|uniref:toll/interleukin-1 receptor domain-containing protein n=1 Tax=Sorangium sp. So ce1078 TaxID=3133329 RepID=UPI003F5E76F3